MSAVGQPNLRRWAGGWDGALRRPESGFVKEGFKLAAKTGYGRTVPNIQGKEIANDGRGLYVYYNETHFLWLLY